MVHQFEEEVLRAPDLLPLGCRFEGLPILAETQPRLYLTRRAPGGRDNSFGVLRDDLLVHARPLAQLTLDRGQRGQLEKVPYSGCVLGDHRHVRVRATTGYVVRLLAAIAPQHTLLVESRLGSDVRLDTDDRFDSGLLGLVVELARAVHVAVVGHSDCRHLEARGLCEHRRDLGGPVEHRVLGVVVQMNERVGHEGSLLKVVRCRNTSRERTHCKRSDRQNFHADGVSWEDVTGVTEETDPLLQNEIGGGPCC